ncbi:hypothetical protein EV175_003242 [Coemansia sp. RSA 1933]|nr:hypothetical protein EV175_003242 [Coemansia sp. RSA 1933]
MALAAAVNAGFYTTYPVGADSVTSGQTITITWTSDDQQPLLDNVSTYTLKFMTGGNMVQTTVATIGDFDISKKSISYTIPTTAAGMYFLMYTADNGAGSSWSTRFSVNGGTTWYPDGVATGVDPGTSTSASSSGNIGDPTQITNSGSDTQPTSSKSDSTPSSSSDGDNSTPTSSSSNSNHSHSANGSSNSSADSAGASSDDNSSGNAASDDTDSADSSDASDEESSSEQSESLDNEDTSSDDSKSSGASAVSFISAAAVAAALALFV